MKVNTESGSVGRAAAAKEVDAPTSAAAMTADSGEQQTLVPLCYKCFDVIDFTQWHSAACCCKAKGYVAVENVYQTFI